MKLQKLLPSVVFAASATAITANAQQISNPILYVTQVPPSQGHNTVLSIDGNLLATTAAAPRGGDLMILYPDLSVKNLTRLAGYGIAGSQQKGPDAIAVRDPHVHFSGTKAVFSMVRGAPSNIGETGEYFWQIYEITGLGKAQTPVITKVPGQHADYNNVQPAYLSDGRIVYATDCPVTGQKHLYPALDEDGLGPAGTGLWAVDPEAPQGTQPVMLTHATSGAAEPFVDSFGRVMFTRWDVLQRDKLAATPGRVLLDYQTEAPNATYGQYTEVFPEPLQSQTEPFGLRFDVFMPWTINQDGGNLNTLNHLGRHELSLDFPRSGPDAGLADFTSNEFSPNSVVPAPTRAGAFFQIAEHPYSPGRYVAIDVTMTNLSAGRVVSVLAPPTMNPDLVTVSLISNVGLTRDVSWNAHGQLMGSWMPPVQGVTIPGSYGAPAPPVDPSTQVSGKFSIRLATTNSKLEQGANLTTPQTITTVQIIGGQEVTFNGTPHQLQPTEVSSRTVPVTTATTPEVETPEASVYIRNGVSPTAFQTWLRQQNKALIVARNVTTRDSADRQQPYSLKVEGGTSSTVSGVAVKTLSRVQFFQGEYLRAYSGSAITTPDAGRRITARSMRQESLASNPPPNGPEGSVPISLDGSMAAIVPAGRAMTWQTMDPNHNAVVRERYWLNFKAGEMRTCTSCHGANTVDQTGKPPATNSPEALSSLLTYWKSSNPGAPAQTTSYKVWSEVVLHDAAGTTAQADTDGDGLTNLQEYVYGSDPKVPTKVTGESHPLTAVSTDEGNITLKFTRNKDATGSEVVAEASADLAAWEEVARVTDSATTTRPGVTIAETTTPGQSTHRVSEFALTVPKAAGSGQYFRLKFVVP